MLRKRARRKYFTVSLAAALADHGKAVSSPLEKGYRNSIYCNASLEQRDGKVRGQFCGNRWCLVCSAIRTAKAWNGYGPLVETWPDRQLVTLTVQNVAAGQLDGRLDEMLMVFRFAKDTMRKAGLKLVALRKLECTYNADRDDYHPHFHFIVETRPMARQLRALWLEHWGAALADPKAQDIRPADPDAVGELFKYFTKLVTKQKMMPVAKLDTIFRALKGRRVFQPVGFVRPSTADDDEESLLLDKGTPAPARRAEEIDWTWNQRATDWVDGSTGDCMTGYEPKEKFRRFVEGITTATGPP